jgi:hypothetical protein
VLEMVLEACPAIHVLIKLACHHGFGSRK